MHTSISSTLAEDAKASFSIHAYAGILWIVMVGLPVQLRERSEDDADDELLSVAIVKHGNKAVTGSQTGVLSLYSWGYSKDCSDRFPGVWPRWQLAGLGSACIPGCYKPL